jgi:fatty-acyl-CoA synthase
MTLEQPSYVCGTSSASLLYLTVGDVLRRAAATWPEHEALIVRHQNLRLTYRELDARVSRLARALLAKGLQPGDRVGIWSPNNAEWILIQFATARAGLILVNINPAYRSIEVEDALRRVGCRLLIMATAFKTSDYVGTMRTLLLQTAFSRSGRISSEAVPNLQWLVHLGSAALEGFQSLDDLLASSGEVSAEALESVSRSLHPDQPINIQFTSGTTGLPKAATLTHFNIVNNAYFSGEAMRLVPADRLCIPVPLYHCFGMVLGVLAAVTHGAVMVLPGESFDAETVLATVMGERCTALHGVPTMFIAELAHPRFHDFDLSSLRTGIMAGAPCPVAIMRRVVDEMHMSQLTICYGMTETSPVSFQSDAEDPFEKRVTTVGRIHPHIQAKIVDTEGRVVPLGSSGELCTRGYSVMQGYWNDREATAAVVDASGWMHTGDLAVLDAAGFCNIVGRIKDVVIRGGENIYPREVEEFLYRHPAVQEVAVVGVADTKYGEEICAVIRLRQGMCADAEEIRAFCRLHIAHYKVPRYIVFQSVFPTTVTGKIRKFELRKHMEALLALKAEQTA